MAQETQTGALYQPRGEDGEGDGRKVQKGEDIGIHRGFPGGSVVKNLSAMQET